MVNLLVDEQQALSIKHDAIEFPSIDLEQHQLCDLELLLNGGLSPLRGYMNRSDYQGVLHDMHLADGTFWPLPITLGINAKTAAALKTGDRLALRDPEGFMLAVLTIKDVWEIDVQREFSLLYEGSEVPSTNSVNDVTHYVGGPVQGISLPIHYDYPSLRVTPTGLRDFFARRGWTRVVAYQASHALHRVDHEIALRITREYEANLLIQPVVGMASADDLNHYNQIRSCQAILPHFPPLTTTLALLPMARRPSGVRNTLWQAIIHRNYGCSYFTSSVACADVQSGDAQDIGSVVEHETTVGVKYIPLPQMVYVEDRSQYMLHDEVPQEARAINLSDSEFVRRLIKGLDIPDWYSYPEVIKEFRRSYPARSKQGFTVFFTGLSGSGKSTLAKVLMTKLLEIGGRQVTLLDGDVIRKNLSSELGFSREHRDLNVRRIGYIASEITKHRGIAICAPIAPYWLTRQAVRDLIEAHGGFFEIHVATPLAICESRDRKGLYAKARAGLIQEFTGVSDPYEEPQTPELYIDTSKLTQEEAVQRILLKLEHEGFID